MKGDVSYLISSQYFGGRKIWCVIKHTDDGCPMNGGNMVVVTSYFPTCEEAEAELARITEEDAS